VGEHDRTHGRGTWGCSLLGVRPARYSKPRSAHLCKALA
jgi:hypothetical protein